MQIKFNFQNTWELNTGPKMDSLKPWCGQELIQKKIFINLQLHSKIYKGKKAW